MIARDLRKPMTSTGQYAVGFKNKLVSGDKYFHVKLGPKTVICGYENLFGKKAEYTYKALTNVDAYGLRKSAIKPILDDEPEFRKQMMQY